jgi:RsiW-degrading membrane proteinase PrsW (M82 family)
MLISLFLTILPSLVIFLYFFFSDHYLEQKKIALQVFVLSFVVALVAGQLNSYILKNFSNNSKINNELLVGFFAGGFVEELLKFSVLYFFVLKNYKLSSVKDAIAYGATVSLGFAAIENFGYVHDISSAIGRVLFPFPMHGMNGVIMGFYIGFYSLKNNIKFLGYAILVPIIFHGTYNFLVSDWLLGFSVLVVMLVFLLQLYKILLQSSKSKFI